MKKKLTQVEIDMSLHELGERTRAAWDQKQADFEKNIAAFREGIREDWNREQEQKRSKSGIEAPKIEEPEIGPPRQNVRDINDPEPER